MAILTAVAVGVQVNVGSLGTITIQNVSVILIITPPSMNDSNFNSLLSQFYLAKACTSS